MEDKFQFSASDLIKKSAAQIKYLQLRRELYRKRLTENCQRGVNYQAKMACKLEAAEEYRGTYCQNDIVIYFCNDLVTARKIVEVKSVVGAVESWYFESSLLQTAFYKAMLMLSNGWLFTPKFRIKEGYARNKIQVNPLIDYHLLFGNKEYKIIIPTIEDAKIIVDFFVQKASIIAKGSWDEARSFDSKYKFKQYEALNNHFKYNLVR